MVGRDALLLRISLVLTCCLTFCVSQTVVGPPWSIDVPKDMCFAIDGSDSVTQRRFAQILTALDIWLNVSNMAEDKVNFAMVTYSSRVDTFIPFERPSPTRGQLKARINTELVRGGGRTFSDQGLVKCLELYAIHNRVLADGSPVPFIVVLITDGNSNNPVATAAIINAILRVGRVFAITIGDTAVDGDWDDSTEYKTLLGDATQHVTSFAELVTKAVALSQVICPTPPQPAICDGCKIRNGVGFNPSEKCDWFVTCLYDLRGDFVSYVERPCTKGQFWSQDILTCMPVWEIQCENDPCIGSSRLTWPCFESCLGYWQCDGERTVGAACCDTGSVYNEAAERCVPDGAGACTDECHLPGDTVEWICELLLNPEDSSGKTFLAPQQQQDGSIEYTEITCPINTAFVQLLCVCADLTDEEPSCEVDFIMNFEQDPLSDLANEVSITNENVDVNVNQACAEFDASRESRLIVQRFGNMEWQDHWAIKLEFNGMGNPNPNAPLFSNFGCKDGGSFEIRLEGDLVVAEVDTYNDSYRLELPSRRNQRNTVYLLYRDMELTLAIQFNNGDIDSVSIAAAGWVIRNECGAVNWGYGDPDRYFTGRLYWGEVWICAPDVFLPTK